MSEMPDKVWIHEVGVDSGCSYVIGVFDPDDREPGDIEYLHNPYGDDGVVVSESAYAAGSDRIAALEAKLAEADKFIADISEELRVTRDFCDKMQEQRDAAQKKLAEAEARNDALLKEVMAFRRDSGNYRAAVDEALAVSLMEVASGDAKADLAKLISWELDVAGYFKRDCEKKLAEAEAAIAKHNAKMDAVPSLGKASPSMSAGLRFLANWFDALYGDAGTGQDTVQQDLRRWANEHDATMKDLHTFMSGHRKFVAEDGYCGMTDTINPLPEWMLAFNRLHEQADEMLVAEIDKELKDDD